MTKSSSISRSYFTKSLWLVWCRQSRPVSGKWWLDSGIAIPRLQWSSRCRAAAIHPIQSSCIAHTSTSGTVLSFSMSWLSAWLWSSTRWRLCSSPACLLYLLLCLKLGSQVLRSLLASVPSPFDIYFSWSQTTPQTIPLARCSIPNNCRSEFPNSSASEKLFMTDYPCFINVVCFSIK